MPPKSNKTKEDGILLKQVGNKKYYWCLHHNEERASGSSITPIACENAQSSEKVAPNVNVAAFDTFNEESTLSEE